MSKMTTLNWSKVLLKESNDSLMSQITLLKESDDAQVGSFDLCKGVILDLSDYTPKDVLWFIPFRSVKHGYLSFT